MVHYVSEPLLKRDPGFPARRNGMLMPGSAARLRDNSYVFHDSELGLRLGVDLGNN